MKRFVHSSVATASQRDGRFIACASDTGLSAIAVQVTLRAKLSKVLPHSTSDFDEVVWKLAYETYFNVNPGDANLGKAGLWISHNLKHQVWQKS